MIEINKDVLAGVEASLAKVRNTHRALREADAEAAQDSDPVVELNEASETDLPTESIEEATGTLCESDPLIPSANGKSYDKWQFQQDASIKVVASVLDFNRRILLVSPTGTGKNHMTAIILSSPDLRKHFQLRDGEDLRVMYFAHKHALLVQGMNEIGCLDGIELIPQSIFSNIPAEVLEKGWHFSIHDEAHHEPMLSFQEKLGYITDAQMLGLTATPERADKFSLKFDDVVVAISREEASRLGFLAPATVHSVLDMGTHDKPELLGDLVDEYGKRMERTIIYLKTKEEAYFVNKMLMSKGYRTAALVDVTNTQFERIRGEFENDELDFVVNCQKLDEGVDFKGVRGVIIARGVLSPPLLNQIIGRAARIDEPECHIWQFIDPLKDNLDACAIVGKQVDHYLYYIRAGKWECDQMSYAVMEDTTGNTLEIAETSVEDTVELIGVDA
jgi:superfamily II DNA or RNA helicase